MSDRNMRWYAQHRQEWIAETLRIFGFINREHIERKFGVSTPQASLDLRDFQRRYPSVIAYDKSAKRYVLKEGHHADDAWHDLCEKDDRTSPADYPDHCLITCDELRQAMEQYHATILTTSLEGADERVTEPAHKELVQRLLVAAKEAETAAAIDWDPGFKQAAGIIIELLTLVTALSAKRKETKRELAAEREKFTMHTAHVGAWLSLATQELGIGKEGDKLDVQTVLSQIMDKVAAANALQSQLTAQKAAHAKMLRERATEIEDALAKADMCSISDEIVAEVMCPELHRLAAKIEGGE